MRARPVWSAAEGDAPILRHGMRPAWNVNNADRARLANAGINLLQAVRIAPKFATSPRTLASGSAAVSDWRYLSARRLALFVLTSVERGTRWMLFERNVQATWTMARAQVEAFLDSLYAEGAFAGRSGEQSYFVVCDERINTEETMRAGKINLAFGFAATKPGEYHAFIVTHQPSGSRAQGDQRESLRELFAERGPGDRVEHPSRAGAAGAGCPAARSGR